MLHACNDIFVCSNVVHSRYHKWGGLLNPGPNMAAGGAVIRGSAISAMLADVTRNMAEVALCRVT